MPDLVTHVAINHIIRRPFDLSRTQTPIFPLRTLFYLGTILPDILTRPWYIIFPETHHWTFLFHTPLGMFITTGLLTLLFESSLRKKAFVNLSAGAGLHFLLDASQKQVVGNNYWLYPFSWKDFGFGIAWAGDFVDRIPLLIALVVILEAFIYLWRKRTHRQKIPLV